MSISIICACKNRYNALRVSLNSWINVKEIKEIIVIDWNSDEPINNITKLDPRIKVIRVSNKEYFNQPQPLNLAASFVTGDYILKLDADYVINPYYNFIEKYLPDENSFTSGIHSYESPEFYNQETGIYMIDKVSMSVDELKEYFNSYSPYFKYLTGLLFVSKENFNKIGGYNENLGKCYAFEDEEILARLRLMGLKENKLDCDYYLSHIPHPDKKRIENFEGVDNLKFYESITRENLSLNYSGEELEWQVEYALSQQHIQENKQIIGEITDYYINSKTKWNIIKVNDQNYIAEEIKVENKLDGFSSVYYVSLEECVDRRKNLEFEFRKYNIQPKSVISKRFSECNDVITGKYAYQLNDGTKGCCVSHLKAIKEWYENTNENYGFFCEDDLSLETVEYWNFTWQQFIESIPEDADCVQLLTIRSEFDTFEIRERYWDDWGATAYIMTRDYAKKIIDTYIKENSYHLEIPNQDIMPLIENILFASVGKTYTYPLFVENVDFKSTFVEDNDVNNGQKTNHYISHKKVLDWWKGKEKNKKFSKKNVVDCFTYFNNKELLELRVNLLKDHVDKFVIVEANYTQSGNPKEYTLKKTIKELGLPEDIIEVIEIDLSEENLGPVTDYELMWDANPRHASRERIQRDAPAKCLETNNFDEDTVFIINDIDEIIDPKHIPMMCDLVRKHRDKIFKVDLVYLEGRSDLRSYHKDTNEPRDWSHAMYFCLKEHMENINLTYIRSESFVPHPYEIVWAYTEPRTENGVFIPGEKMRDLGWHFTWMGTNENRFLKSQSVCHFDMDLNELLYKNYLKEQENWKDFFLNYDMGNEDICPSGDINYTVKPYPIENLPQIIFDLPRVKEFLLPETKENNKPVKTELEQLLYEYSLDTENPEHNFNLGVWYENEGHTAPALSYFLRCAERAHESNPDLAYEALIRGSYCYEKQGTRDGSARSMLWQAQAFRPDRPEAYFLLARFAERREWWQDCYMNADLALRYCNFDNQPLRTNVEYPGQYGLLYLKSVAAWWWGKGKETRLLLQEIKNNHQVRSEDFDLIQSRLMELATGYISESELKYTKSSGQELRFKFDGCENIERNYSQAFQDLFVLTALNGKENGTYLEIGAQEPFYQNNTALLETQFAWKGVSIEIRQDLCQMFSQQRKNTILCQDATKIDYLDLLNKFDSGSTIDYLQVDCEPSKTTFEILLMIPFNDYKFRIITYEHDYYVDLTNSYRDKSREYLMSKGYKLLVSNVALNEWSPFEDWWYHPDLVDSSIVEQIKNISDITDIRHYMIKT